VNKKRKFFGKTKIMKKVLDIFENNKKADAAAPAFPFILGFNY